MSLLRKYLCIVLILTQVSVHLQAGVVMAPDASRRLVAGLGAGADVKVELKTGESLRGVGGEQDENGFVLASRKFVAPRNLTYEQIAEVKLLKCTLTPSPPPRRWRRAAQWWAWAWASM